ncbi:hypothetical protein LTR84_002025 [Exophiala bonariae]|uniref:Transcription factor domain-containing protein n=1 Tax=Exophiala bonariae TaxID=1690606 RepID=A0AAV9NA84_9EURO|nr:hypothetical protein LTR84_002025 [Exophiala bonariae]
MTSSAPSGMTLYSRRYRLDLSHLYSLSQKKQRLESEISNIKARSQGSRTHSGLRELATDVAEQSYHLTILSDGLSSASPTAYLGPGSLPRLLERLLKNAIYWHLASNLPVPKHMLQKEPSRSLDSQSLTSSPSFYVTMDQRKLELQSLVPPSTQRAVLDHYMKVVSVQYPLLTYELESAVMMHENPLRWSSANKDHPGSLALSIMFAISSTLITRDLDPTLSSIALRCVGHVQKIAQGLRSQDTRMETLRWTCTALCALALCEAISPRSGQLWDLLGRACSTIEDLREEYQIQNVELDDPFVRLEHSLLKLESCTALFLRLQSPICAMRLRPMADVLAISGPLSDDLETLCYQQHIVGQLTRFSLQGEEFFESLIPFRFRVVSTSSQISIHSAMLYLTLHPIYTTSDAFSCISANVPTSRLFQIVAQSAATIIDHFTHLNEDKKILSVCMAAAQVLEAGFIWAAYLISANQPAQNGPLFAMEKSVALSPILKVSALLASFVARWESGSVYTEAWETFVQLLWNMI